MAGGLMASFPFLINAVDVAAGGLQHPGAGGAVHGVDQEGWRTHQADRHSSEPSP